MFVVIIKNKVSLLGKQKYIEESLLFAQDMEEVNGCMHSYVIESNEQEDIIVNLEIWESKEAYEKYDGSVFFKHKAKLKPYFLGNTTETYIML
ncbi:MAG: antibiotic biosynthesis monooxygenase [Erysipelotrichaceae bacterium]|nr:antibiotic biosynthesis monooxygenase [Erysipelotrichaceae bacterium]